LWASALAELWKREEVSTKKARGGRGGKANALLLLLELVSDGVKAGGGTVGEGGVGVALGNLLVGLLRRARDELLGGLGNVVDGVRDGVGDGAGGGGGGGGAARGKSVSDGRGERGRKEEKGDARHDD
jgi:hypothetical protein